jgi:hypothetical protein
VCVCVCVSDQANCTQYVIRHISLFIVDNNKLTFIFFLFPKRFVEE